MTAPLLLVSLVQAANEDSGVNLTAREFFMTVPLDLLPACYNPLTRTPGFDLTVCECLHGGSLDLLPACQVANENPEFNLTASECFNKDFSSLFWPITNR